MERLIVGGKEVSKEDLAEFLHAGFGSYRCGIYLYNLDPLYRQQIYHELETERLMDKYNEICHRHSLSMDWNQIFLLALMETLSDKHNKANYMELAMHVKYGLIARERTSLQSLETLLIAASGLLPTLPRDEFTRKIARDAEYLLHKYQISPMPAKQWKRGLRVKNPILRLSQVARLFYDNQMPFNRLMGCRTRDDIISFFHVPASKKWCRYFDNGAISHIGIDKCDLIGINLVVPILFAFGHYSSNDDMINTACELNEALPVEWNGIIGRWKERGLTPTSAYEGQALLQLYKRYCARDKCPQCVVFRHMCSKANIFHKVPIFLENMR